MPPRTGTDSSTTARSRNSDTLAKYASPGRRSPTRVGTHACGRSSSTTRAACALDRPPHAQASVVSTPSAFVPRCPAPITYSSHAAALSSAQPNTAHSSPTGRCRDTSNARHVGGRATCGGRRPGCSTVRTSASAWTLPSSSASTPVRSSRAHRAASYDGCAATSSHQRRHATMSAGARGRRASSANTSSIVMSRTSARARSCVTNGSALSRCVAGSTGISRQKSASIADGKRTASDERAPAVESSEMHGRVQHEKNASSRHAPTRADGDERWNEKNCIACSAASRSASRGSLPASQRAPSCWIARSYTARATNPATASSSVFHCAQYRSMRSSDSRSTVGMNRAATCPQNPVVWCVRKPMNTRPCASSCGRTGSKSTPA